MCLLQASYIKIKVFGFKGEFQSNYCENLTEFYQISLKILVNLTDFNPQAMAFMNCFSLKKFITILYVIYINFIINKKLMCCVENSVDRDQLASSEAS